MTHVLCGRQPVAEALRAGRRLLQIVVDARGGVDLDRLAATARAAGVDVRVARRDELDALTEGVLHQGVVATAPDFPYVTIGDLRPTDLVVVLDGVTDPQNLGAIARSAEQAGAGAIVLPKRRAAHVTASAEKAAAGAFSWLQVALVPNIVRALQDLARGGFWSVGLGGGAVASVWDCDLLDGRVAVVVGAEGRGLSRLTADRVDALVRIPTVGRLDSLNASVAAGVALFEVVRRRTRSPAPGVR